MTKFALALGIAFAITSPPVAAWAGFDPPNQLAAPFSPNVTIYRPDCSIKEERHLTVNSPPRNRRAI